MPEAFEYLATARRFLEKALAFLDLPFADEAARAAYLAAFHAAQAYIVLVTGRSAKTPSGVHTEFSRLARTDPRLPQGLSTFLARAYDLKEETDYGLGASAQIGLDDAAQALETARAFVAAVAVCVETPDDAR